MGQIARRFCRTHNCPSLVDGSGYCATCRARRGPRQASAHQRGYTRAWDAFSTRWLLAHPLCGERADGRLHAQDSRCVQLGLRTRADVTDHIRSLALGGANCEPANSQSLCRACNSRKAVRVEGSFVCV